MTSYGSLLYTVRMFTQSYLKSILTYDPTTGLFAWNKSGKIAGGVSGKGEYWCITIEGTFYRAHRLAWLYVYGYWPTALDHKNRVKTDNWIDNLRETTPSQNVINSDRYDLYKRTLMEYGTVSALFKGEGVYYRKDRDTWRARTWVRTPEGKRKRVSIGCFKTKEAALKAYDCYIAARKGNISSTSSL